MSPSAPTPATSDLSETRSPSGAAPFNDSPPNDSPSGASPSDDSPAHTRPPWIGRALVEAGLIVFAVVLGFLVNEGREAAADRRAAEEAMRRVVAEIETNIERLDAVVVYHEAVAARIGDRLAELAEEAEAGGAPVEGVLFTELGRVMPNGVNAPGLTSHAWDHARQHGRLGVLPYETVAETARVYTLQNNGVEGTWRRIIELLFAGPDLMRPQDLASALSFTRIGFRELASQERFLIGQKQRLLERLRAEGY